MKKITILALLASAIISNSFAINGFPVPKDTTKTAGKWDISSTPALKVGEFLYHNWSASGNSQIDITATFFGNYKYTHSKFVWDNIADLAYGYAWQDLDNLAVDSIGGRFETHRKSNDKIDLTSALSWKAYKDWGASFTANFKSQFGNGYTYDGIGFNATANHVSGFLAPGYLTTALSFEYKKTDWFVSLSFLTGKTTFVCDDSLIIKGYNYGVIQDDDFNETDPSTYDLINHVYFALGTYVKAQYLKRNIVKNLDLYTRAELFYDYRKPHNMGWNKNSYTNYVPVGDETWSDMQKYSWFHRRAFETDLDLTVRLDYRFSSFLSANLSVNLKWDTDYSGMGNWGHWQVYQMAGLQLNMNWKPKK